MTSPARKKAKEKALQLKQQVGKQPKRIKGSTYVTKKGDTLSDIADKMGLTVRQIRASNPKMFKDAKKMNEIPTGIRLKIPTVKSIGKTVDFASKKSPKKVYDLSKKDMEAISKEKEGFNKGGLRAPTNPGLKKLPTAVRNRMGFMSKGSLATKKKTKGTAKGGKGVIVVSIGIGKMKKPKKKTTKKKTTKKS